AEARVQDTVCTEAGNADVEEQGRRHSQRVESYSHDSLHGGSADAVAVICASTSNTLPWRQPGSDLDTEPGCRNRSRTVSARAFRGIPGWRTADRRQAPPRGAAGRRPDPCIRSGRCRMVQRAASPAAEPRDRKSTRLNSSHVKISYAVFCLK